MKSKVYTYEQALQSSIEYFGGDELSAKVFTDKYCLRAVNGDILEDTPQKMHWRIANEFARIEAKKFKKPMSAADIFGLIDRFKYIVPQGSPMFGIGNNNQIISLSNCFLLDVPLDSYSSILQVDEQLVNISKRRGGVGIDLSNLRPAGTVTRNAARQSTGIVTWMERYSNSIREVGQGGRRGALMLTLSVHHPDILAFCTVKNDPAKVTGANISVRLTREFLDAVKKDKNYELRFPVDYKEKGIEPQFTKKVSAKEVWDTIISCAWLRAEPGLLMWDNVVENTPADCYEEYKSRGTNPCSEINLSPLDSCRLLCVNLLSYVTDPFTEKAAFDFTLFRSHAKLAQRLMDDLVDLESEKIDGIIEKVISDPEPENVKRNEIALWTKIKKLNDDGRRTGTGITALGDTLAALGIKYGSKESIAMTEEIYKTLKLGCYESSVDMAEELGSFMVYDAKAEENCPFIQRIAGEEPDLYARMIKAGRRNISLTTTAPTGSVSLMTQTTSGIEPLFMTGYTRRKKINPNDKGSRVDFVDDNGDSWQEFVVYHPTVKKWMEATGKSDIKDSPWYGCCAEDINWNERVMLQAAAQKHVCHAISSTINLPESVTKAKVAEIYQTAFENGLKGITVYRKNCRSGVMVETKQAENKRGEKIVKTIAPKRPQKVPGELHHFVIKGHRYFVAVGLLDDEPYEIFGGSNNDAEGEPIIPKSVSSGTVIKHERGKYGLKSVENEYSIVGHHSDANIDALTRMISTALRHGADISFVVHQLEKTKGEMQSFAKILARTLKKYIKDGTKVSGEKCPECKRDDCKIVREDGCIKCVTCGWTKCG
jgi:ribonucleoside-diphosphate reductase alpha chain